MSGDRNDTRIHEDLNSSVESTRSKDRSRDSHEARSSRLTSSESTHTPAKRVESLDRSQDSFTSRDSTHTHNLITNTFAIDRPFVPPLMAIHVPPPPPGPPAPPVPPVMNFSGVNFSMPPPPPPTEVLAHDSDIDSVEMEDAMSEEREAEISSTTSPHKATPVSTHEPSTTSPVVKTKAQLKQPPPDVAQEALAMASAGDSTDLKGYVTPEKSASETAKPARVRKSRFGPPVPVAARTGLFDVLQQAPTPSNADLPPTVSLPSAPTLPPAAAPAEEEIAERTVTDQCENSSAQDGEESDTPKRRRSSRLRHQRKDDDAGREVKGSKVQGRRGRKKKDESQDFDACAEPNETQAPPTPTIKQVRCSLHQHLFQNFYKRCLFSGVEREGRLASSRCDAATSQRLQLAQRPVALRIQQRVESGSRQHEAQVEVGPNIFLVTSPI